MIISTYIVWFAAFSLLGWVFECALNVIREGTWENRGFLYGPVCPIYGVGVVLFMLAFDNPFVTNGQLPLWGVFFAAMAGSAVLEYTTSVLMEKAFGARWWDYSNMPLNINGRICLPASLLFGAGGVGTVLVLLPAAHMAASIIPALVWEAAALVFVVAFTVDATLSFVALTEIMKKVEEASDAFDRVMDNSVQNAQQAARDAADKAREATDKARDAADKAREAANHAIAKFQLLNALTFGRITNVTANQVHIPTPVTSFVEGLNKRQRRVLASIKRFGSSKTTEFGALARQAIHKANERLTKEERGISINADIAKVAHIVSGVRSKGVQEMKTYCHHGSVSTYKHCLRVTWCAFRINRSLRLNSSEEELVRAAMLHDYFGYDWHHTTNKKHATNHPVLAEGRATSEFGLTAKEQNIVLSHMWPLPPTRIPRYREAWIVCVADKICALEETLFMR